MLAKYDELSLRMGKAGASERAAELIISYLKS
jgi:hypothetical protein